MQLTDVIKQLNSNNLTLVSNTNATEISIKDKVEGNCNTCYTTSLIRLEALYYNKNYIHCKSCRDTAKRKDRFKSFLEKAIKQHGSRYTYNEDSFKEGSVDITCKEHGIFRQKIKDHVYKNGCPSCGTNSYFKKGENTLNLNEIKETLKYTDKNITVDYSTYTTWESKTLTATCKIHGEFITSPKNFKKRLNKCLECAEYLNSHSKSNFAKIAKKNMKGKAKLYIIKCTDDFETFYKIGITTHSLTERFRKKGFPYTYEVIQEITDEAVTIWTLEKVLHKYFKNIQYLPKKDFSGKYECFKIKDEVLNP